MYTIYRHAFPNGKSYIGITKASVKKRWKNGGGYKTCPLVDRAIKKYGWENIGHQILRKCETKEMAEMWEKFYIAWYKSNNPAFGYNILLGGDVSGGQPDSVREKIGKAKIGKRLSEDHKRKISEGVKRTFSRPESNGWFGKKASEETKRKMSASHKGKTMSENSGLSKPIIQLTMDGEFVARYACARDAYRAGFAHYSTISKCCLHQTSQARGYRWMFEEEYITS